MSYIVDTCTCTTWLKLRFVNKSRARKYISERFSHLLQHFVFIDTSYNSVCEVEKIIISFQILFNLFGFCGVKCRVMLLLEFGWQQINDSRTKRFIIFVIL